MVRIVDRRFDSKKKSTVNRQRFMQRYTQQIRRAVAESMRSRSIRDTDSGESVSIPGKDLTEPHFSHGKGGIWEQVFAGNDQFAEGDLIDRPSGSGTGGAQGQASDRGEQEDDFTFTLSREEFLELFFDDLALPNLVRTQLADITEYKSRRAGFKSDGVPANLNVVRSLRGALGRRLALAAPLRSRLRALAAELEVLEAAGSGSDPERLAALRAEMARLRTRIEAIPFIDEFDLRYNNRVRIPQPSTRAAMFCLMDVSGSMDEEKKAAAKRFFMLLYLFLTRSYERIDLVFIRHHTVAKEVSEEEFFHSRESGGTVVSSALHLMRDLLRTRYQGGRWNIYGAQASDGDNWDNDSPHCRELLDRDILPCCQHFAYVEITPGEPQNLWRQYQQLVPIHAHFAMQRVAGPADIYPVFRELFRKRLTP